jgi:quercetin dioxygenase-like cupin family protein
MAIHHAEPGEVIDIHPLGSHFAQAVTTTLAKSNELEIIRLILPAGKKIPPHKVAGPITVQCLEGRVEFQVFGKWQTLEPGQLLFLTGGEMHAAKSLEDSSVLITIHLTTEHAVQESAAGLLLSRFGHDPEAAETAPLDAAN